MRDGAKNRIERIAGPTVYSYDVKAQLLQEQSTPAGGYTHAFAYDSAGNATP